MGHSHPHSCTWLETVEGLVLNSGKQAAIPAPEKLDFQPCAFSLSYFSKMVLPPFSPALGQILWQTTAALAVDLSLWV